jgi:hypothetical protein
MVIVNSILISLLVVLLVAYIGQLLMETGKLKDNSGTLVGLIVWLLVVIAIGFQQLPWLANLIDKKS